MKTIEQAKRVVIKVGSSLTADPATSQPRREWMHGLMQDIATLKQRGAEIVLVTSGAVALGRLLLGLPLGSLTLEDKQAAAAAGQIRLMQAWSEAAEAHRMHMALILLTAEDTESRRRYLNARNTFDRLLKHGAIPVINENDTVATTELRYGDNDQLAARVATMIGADLLILFSDIDGLYTGDPRHDQTATHIPVIHTITPEIDAMAGGVGSGISTGGMKSKLAAARIATAGGCHMLLAQGNVDRPLLHVQNGGKHSHFTASESPHGARKRWLASTLQVHGSITIDDGAMAALRQGKSLLPAGVREIQGEFERGDAVAVLTLGGERVGTGLIAYRADDARRILGKRSADIETILGYQGRVEMMHRDDMVLQ